MKRVIVGLMLGTTFAFLASSSYAIPLTYEVGAGSSVTANTSDPGLLINTALDADLASVAFGLDDGDSYSFSFFKIWANEDWVNSDDLAPKAISAVLDFAVPSETATIGGSTVGVSVGVLGFYQAGRVIWSGPTVVNAGDRVFSVTLSDETFGEQYWWLGLGECGATVEATVTQGKSWKDIPTTPDGGASLALLGMGLIGLGVLKRKLS